MALTCSTITWSTARYPPRSWRTSSERGEKVLLLLSHQTADLSGSARHCGFPTGVELQVCQRASGLLYFSYCVAFEATPSGSAARTPACLVAAVIAHLAALPKWRLLHPANHFPWTKSQNRRGAKWNKCRVLKIWIISCVWINTRLKGFTYLLKLRATVGSPLPGFKHSAPVW